MGRGSGTNLCCLEMSSRKQAFPFEWLAASLADWVDWLLWRLRRPLHVARWFGRE